LLASISPCVGQLADWFVGSVQKAGYASHTGAGAAHSACTLTQTRALLAALPGPVRDTLQRFGVGAEDEGSAAALRRSTRLLTVAAALRALDEADEAERAEKERGAVAAAAAAAEAAGAAGETRPRPRGASRKAAQQARERSRDARQRAREAHRARCGLGQTPSLWRTEVQSSKRDRPLELEKEATLDYFKSTRGVVPP
jgi:hypothetical protein